MDNVMNAASPTARDLMTADVHCVPKSMSLKDVVAFLLSHKISNAPVVDETAAGRVLLGFISERDCLDYLSNEMFMGSPAQPQTAETIMRRHPVCVSPESDVFSLASIFISHDYRHLPVVDHNHLVGIVSRRDVLLELEKMYAIWLETKNLERFPPDLKQLINLRFISRNA
jgi:CBS domain-containing protein